MSFVKATYEGPGGIFTAHKSAGNGTGWITGIPTGETETRYIGGRGSIADAIDAAIKLANGEARP